MRTAALVLSAFAGFPSAPTPSFATSPLVNPMFAAPTAVGWHDSLWLDSIADVTRSDSDPLLPEASAADEVASDLVMDVDPSARVTLVGCELGLAESLEPDAWARELWLGAPSPQIVDAGHTDKEGQWLDYEQIPRRPERPEAYTAYQYPVADAPVVSGYDLDKPDDEQRRGRMHAVGHGGVDLMAAMGTPINAVRLDHQVGDAEVLYVGPLYGDTVVTRHVVRENGVDHDYVLLFGHLERVADNVRRGFRVREGATLGFVGNTASPEFVHLHLEARRVRNGVDAWRLPGPLLDARQYTVVTDPRNVLPLRASRMRSTRCTPHLPPVHHTYWLGDTFALQLGD